ncbi:MAG: FKBP-type peptidyl-prolyl cis-trans isomerase [Planctomycetota bacterium]
MTLFLKTCWCALTVGLLAGPWALANADEHGHDHADHEGHAHHDHAGHDHDHGDHDHAHDAAATETAATVDDGFANDVDRVSYAIGMDIGGNMQANDLEINPAVLGEAIATAYTQGETRMTPEQAMAVIQRWQQQMQMKQMEAMMKEQEEAAAANTAASEAFFADNKNAEGVQVTESGLQYVITEKGDGPLPGPSDSVTVHYKGQLLDGEVFDSSYDRGSPATFPINGVIPGFGEGLQLMPVGSKGTLFIPGEIAYGMQGGPGGPNAALIFDVEIIATESPAGQEPLPALGD